MLSCSILYARVIGTFVFIGAGRYGAKSYLSTISIIESGNAGTMPVISRVSSDGSLYKSARRLYVLSNAGSAASIKSSFSTVLVTGTPVSIETRSNMAWRSRGSSGKNAGVMVTLKLGVLSAIGLPFRSKITPRGASIKILAN